VVVESASSVSSGFRAAPALKFPKRFLGYSMWGVRDLGLQQFELRDEILLGHTSLSVGVSDSRLLGILVPESVNLKLSSGSYRQLCALLKVGVDPFGMGCYC
jgi:hypothetical protein